MTRANDWRRACLASWMVLLLLPLGAWAEPGDLDASFDGDGTVVTSFGVGFASEVIDLLVQPDGKVVAVGWVDESSDRNWALARYETDGSLDPTFGTGGMTTLDFNAGQSANDDVPFAAVLQPDGKIVVVGEAYDYVDSQQVSALAQAAAVVRFNSDGTPDTTFSGDGKMTGFGIVFAPTIKVMREARGVVLQSDGKIVVAGTYEETQLFPLQVLRQDFAIARLLDDGSLDPTFDADGIVVTPMVGFSRAEQVAIQPDGRIVAAGARLVVRYDANGSVDASFNVVVSTPPPPTILILSVSLLVVQPDGKIMFIGDALTFDPDPLLSLAIVRLNSDGSYDPSFGGGGVRLVDPRSDFLLDSPALQPDGRLLAARAQSNGTDDDFRLARYLTDGSPDPSLGGNGTVITDLGAAESVRNVTLQADGRILVAGASGGDFAIARYLGAPFACADPVPCSRAKLIAANLLAPAGDEKLKVACKATLPTPVMPPLLPFLNGARVVVTDALGATVVDATIPGGFYETVTKTGWTSNQSGTVWTFKSPGTAEGITRFSIRTNQTPGLIKFRVKGKNGTYPVGQPPLTASLILDPLTAEQCVVGSWPAAPPLRPSCGLTAGGSMLKCK